MYVDVLLSMLSMDKDKGLGCICTKGSKKMHQCLLRSTVVHPYRLELKKKIKRHAYIDSTTYERSFASRSISHITRLNLIDSDGYGDMKARDTSKPNTTAERQKGLHAMPPYMLPGLDATQRDRVCVYVWLLIDSPLYITYRIDGDSNYLHTSSSSGSRAVSFISLAR